MTMRTTAATAAAAAAVLAALLAHGGSTAAAIELIGSKHVIGYYASWQWYDRDKLASPASLDYTKVTRVNFAFFQPDVDGNVWGTDEWADPAVLFGDIDYTMGSSPGTGGCAGPEESPDCKCHRTGPGETACAYRLGGGTTGLIHAVHEAGREIYPSIGGWTLSGNFPAMAANEASRLNFARNCRDLIVEYDFDGIDIDWEYPGYADHGGTPGDAENFNLLLRDVRAALDDLGAETDKTYGLTAALPCGPSNIENVDVAAVSGYLSELNLMTYDFHGSWDATVGVNSPLHDQSSDPEPGWSLDGCAKNWVALGAPREKMNVGLAFYGRSFRGATELGTPHGGADDSSWTLDEGSPQYFNIIEKIDEMTVVWDDETSTPIAYFSDGSGIVSYDDERSICLKTEYAVDERLNGFIIWELSGDVMGDLSTPLLDSVYRKLTVARTDCAGQPLDPGSSSSEVATSEVVGVTTAADAATQSTTADNTATQSAIIEDPMPQNTMATADTTPAGTTTAGMAAEYGSATEETSTPIDAEPLSSTATSELTTEGESIEISPWEESMTDWSTGTTASVQQSDGTKPLWQSQDQYTQYYDGRKKIKRNYIKPDRPYRPPKETEFA